MIKMTKDQKFSIQNGGMRAEIDICPTKERVEDPSVKTCRHGVLTIQNVNRHGEVGIGYVVYDRLLNRIVNGVFYSDLKAALKVAWLYNVSPDSPQDMAPNGYALGLIYPTRNRDEDGEEVV